MTTTNRLLALVAAGGMIAAGGLTATRAEAATTVINAEGLTQPAGGSYSSFNGAFCRPPNVCVSVTHKPVNVYTEAARLQKKIEATPGDIIVKGYSLGAGTIYEQMKNWAANPALAPDPRRVKLIVTYGNPRNALGGKDPSPGLPDSAVLDRYRQLDVVAQYDAVADVPDRKGYYSSINLSASQHFAYEHVDINDPDNLVWKDPDSGTTHMLLRADVLPMLQKRDAWTSDAKMAELDAKYRPLIEKDYDRPPLKPQGTGADWAGTGGSISTAAPVTAQAEKRRAARAERRKARQERREARQERREARNSQ
jgi:hypothetical protein